MQLGVGTTIRSPSENRNRMALVASIGLCIIKQVLLSGLLSYSARLIARTRNDALVGSEHSKVTAPQVCL